MSSLRWPLRLKTPRYVPQDEGSGIQTTDLPRIVSKNHFFQASEHKFTQDPDGATLQHDNTSSHVQSETGTHEHSILKTVTGGHMWRLCSLSNNGRQTRRHVPGTTTNLPHKPALVRLFVQHSRMLRTRLDTKAQPQQSSPLLHAEPMTPRCCPESLVAAEVQDVHHPSLLLRLVHEDRALLQLTLQVRAGPVRLHAVATMTTRPPWSRKLLTGAETVSSESLPTPGCCHSDWWPLQSRTLAVQSIRHNTCGRRTQ